MCDEQYASLLKNVYFCTVVLTIDGLRHGAKIEILKKVVHIESARRQIMHIVLLKKASHNNGVQHNPPLK